MSGHASGFATWTDVRAERDQMPTGAERVDEAGRDATLDRLQRLATRLKTARLRHAGTVEDVDFRAPRGLDRGAVLSLANAGWVTHHHNLLITGATGCGKSFLCCALAHAAIRQGHTALYVRMPRLLDDLAVGRGDGRYQRVLAQLQRASLLVVDDFLLTPATVEQCRDLLEVVEDRAQLRSTLVASQLPSTPGTAIARRPAPALSDSIGFGVASAGFGVRIHWKRSATPRAPRRADVRRTAQCVTRRTHARVPSRPDRGRCPISMERGLGQ